MMYILNRIAVEPSKLQKQVQGDNIYCVVVMEVVVYGGGGRRKKYVDAFRTRKKSRLADKDSRLVIDRQTDRQTK